MMLQEVSDKFKIIEDIVAKRKIYDAEGDMTLPDTWLYLALSALYREWRSEAITRDEARRLKNILLSQYDLAKFGERGNQWCVDVRRRTIGQLSEAEKSGCPVCQKLVRLFDGMDKE